ncbi:MAG: FG-GAP-like repeat-containing protein [Desulfobacterales bacterium]|nr:FG-GAP-like repeat-containing protein [Desulfobacterales bacterium]
MKFNSFHSANRFLAAGVAFLLATLLAAADLKADTARVLVVPFSIHSDQDLTFLQKGITAMLSTRLSSPGKVTIVDQSEAVEITTQLPQPLERETAAEAGQKLGAQYVAFGSLTVFGGSISTDARFVDVATNTIVVSFNETGRNHGDVISHINAFAGEVNSRVFGRGAQAATAPPAAEAQPQTPADKSQMNPEKKMFQSGSGMRIGATDSDIDASDEAIWRSRRFNFQISGLAMADVDGDGRTETVFAGDREVSVFRSLDRKFMKVTTFELDSAYTILTLDAADINANGRAEIFINCRNDKFIPRVFVMEWNGSTFDAIHSESFWFYRVSRDGKTKRTILFGQKSRTNTVVRGPAHHLAWNEGTYQSQATVPLPKGVSVFGVAYGDVTRNDVENVVVFDRKDNIRVLGPGGNEEWSSYEPFGGSYTWMMTVEEYRNTQKEGYLYQDKMPDNVFWLPQRILLVDINNNGHNAVIVVQNADITQGIMQRVRAYRQGRFECLVWDNVGLTAVWRTRRFSGYISDYNLGDFDNDGRDELVFAVVKRIGDPVTGDKKSYLVSWDPYRQEQQLPAEPAPVEF